MQIEDYNKQLKYCPFCGSTATLVGTYTCQYKEVTYSVKCTGETPHELKIYSTMPEVVVKAWNKRVFQQTLQKYEAIVEDVTVDKVYIKEPFYALTMYPMSGKYVVKLFDCRKGSIIFTGEALTFSDAEKKLVFWMENNNVPCLYDDYDAFMKDGI